MKTTVKTSKKDEVRNITMDDKIFQLRKEIWKLIFQHRGDLSDRDVAMALGIVLYELVHHIKE